MLLSVCIATELPRFVIATKIQFDEEQANADDEDVSELPNIIPRETHNFFFCIRYLHLHESRSSDHFIENGRASKSIKLREDAAASLDSGWGSS